MLAVLIIICFILAFIVLLSVPLDLKFTWDSRHTPSSQFRLEGIFGAFKKDIHRAKVKSGRKKGRIREKPGLGEELYHIRDFIEIIKIKGLVKQTLCLARNGLSQLKIEHFSGNIRFGLDDPSDTGFIFGLINSIKPFINYYADNFSVHPIFNNDTVVFEGNLQGTVRVQPIRLIMPLARFIFSPAAIKLVRKFISQKCKKRKYTLSYQLKSLA